MATAHPIDTALASSWALVGMPTVISSGLFVQRSWMSGRPWMRFLRKLDDSGWWESAHKTKREAVAL